jgi:heme oxygenase
MEYFYGPDWRTTIDPPTDATRSYMNRIHDVASSPDRSYLLVAHQYTRYLGDLFGGQMMGTMAVKSMGLPMSSSMSSSSPGGPGVAFYRFENITDTMTYITGWYRRLNSLHLTEQERRDIVDEANLVFDLNIGIFKELEGSPTKAVWTMAVRSVQDKLRSVLPPGFR